MGPNDHRSTRVCRIGRPPSPPAAWPLSLLTLLVGVAILAAPGAAEVPSGTIHPDEHALHGDTIHQQGDTIEARRIVIRRPGTRPMRPGAQAGRWVIERGDTLPRITVHRLFPQRAVDRNAELGIEFDGQSLEEPVEGVRILRVRPSSPAHDGGLQEGDLIVGYQGHPLAEPLVEGEDELDPEVDRPAARFLHLTSRLGPGDTVQLRVRRNGEEHVRELVARERLPRSTRVIHGPGGVPEIIAGDTERLRARGAFPRTPPLAFRGDTLGFESDTIRVWPPGGSGIPEIFRQLVPGVQRFGIRLHDMNEELGRYFDGADGVLVLEVRENPPLELQAGDVIVAIAGRQVDDAAHAGRILASYRSDEEISIEIRRMGQSITVEGITP